jgi:RNA polymerase sigma factor (sigma-70 family)
MEFEQLVIEMNPMIEKILNNCGIYKNRDEYRQIALISLWKAYSSYDKSKYKFKAYLYNQMRYDVIDALRYYAKREAVFIPTEDETLSFYLENAREILASSEILEKMFKHITEEEKQLLHAIFEEQKTSEEMAKELGISVEAVRKRKYRLRSKLKRLGNSI